MFSVEELETVSEQCLYSRALRDAKGYKGIPREEQHSDNNVTKVITNDESLAHVPHRNT